MELSEYCVDIGNTVAIKAFIENISPDVLIDLKKYSKKGKMTKELAFQFGSLSYDIIASFVQFCEKASLSHSDINFIEKK